VEENHNESLAFLLELMLSLNMFCTLKLCDTWIFVLHLESEFFPNDI